MAEQVGRGALLIELGVSATFIPPDTRRLLQRIGHLLGEGGRLLTAFVLVIFWVVGAVSPAGAIEGDSASWGRYVPGSISEVIDSQTTLVCDGAAPGHPVWTIPGEDHARQAVLTYTGLNKPIGALHREMLSNWLTSLGFALAMGEVFDREYLFHEKDRAYWIPVQAPVAAYFSTELEPNSPVLLYVVWAGAHCTGEEATWLFLVNEFEPIEIMPTGAQPSVT